MKKILLIILGVLLVGSVLALNAYQNVTANILPGKIDVFSPVQDAVYDKRMVLINLSMSAEVSFFKYADNGEGRLVTLCRNCDSFSRKKPFDDGFHELTIFGMFDAGNVTERINFGVDSKKPRISVSSPKKNKVTNGSDFYIKYTENNLKEVSVNFNPNIILTQCNESGKNKECSINLNLSAYDNTYIDYWFNVSDFVRSVQSRITRVFVDTTSPVLNLNLPNSTTYGRLVPFDLEVSEDVKLEYYDLLALSPRWRTLCSNCDEYEENKAFARGNHNVLIRAVDKAGNSDLKQVNFTVSY